MAIEKSQKIQQFKEIHKDIYYIFGNYIYNIIKPNVNGDLEIFKYILGKIYLQNILSFK